MAPLIPSLRRLVAAALMALAALALVPVAAHAATPASLRLLGTDHAYGRVTITAVDGTTHTGSPGLLRLRITPTGGTAVDRPGFCVDLRHLIGEGRDYSVRVATASDLPVLTSARHREAGWLIGQAEALIAAQPATARALEAGALQVAVWQLVGEAREAMPTGDAALNARAAALRALASGRAPAGPVAIAPEMPRGCAGRSAVRLRLTGAPGSTATLSATGASAVLSAAEVRFGADGTAAVSVTSATAGPVSVTARSTGGTLARLVRATSGQTTPQETMVLTPPTTHTARADVVFEDCPAVPFEGDGSPTTPATPAVPAPVGDTPVAPFEAPVVPAPESKPDPATPRRTEPRDSSQTGPRLRVRKTGPARATAGARVTYRIRVSNRGAAALRDVSVTDRMPDGMSLAALPAGARLRGGQVVWTIASLAPGATRVLTVRARLDADAAGRRCNRASASAAGLAASTARACTTVRPLRRKLLPAVTA